MTDRRDDPDRAWTAFAQQLDAFLGQPRHDHGIPTDPPGLGRAILGQPDLSAGALGLWHRLMEQVGPQEGHNAWLEAWKWVRDHHRAAASDRLQVVLDELITALREGGQSNERLAEAGSLLEDLELDDPKSTED
jgi:hypothetical protein